MRRVVASLFITLGMVLALVAGTGTANATQGFCGISWGSLPKVAGDLNPSPLVDVRAGRHQCFDRVVFTVAGSTGTGYDVRYVSQVTQDGSGNVVTVPGGARLAVVLSHPAYDENGNQTVNHLPDVRGFDTLRSVRWAGSYEGMTTVGVGTRARLPFRVFTLNGPGGDTRIVLDVAHRWS